MREIVRDEFSGSAKSFAMTVDLPLSTIRSYLDEDKSRSPSAAVLYQIWERLGYSPTWLLTGAGERIVAKPTIALKDWCPELFANARTAVYMSNSEVSFSSELNGPLTVCWLSKYQEMPSREFDVRTEAGVMAIFRDDDQSGGEDWSKWKGIRLRVQAMEDTTILIKLKTGRRAFDLFEIGQRINVGQKASIQTVRFNQICKSFCDFNPKFVRVFTIAAEPNKETPKIKVTIHQINAIE